MGIAMASLMDTGPKKGAEDKAGGAANEKTAGALVGELVTSIRTVASFTAEAKFYKDYCVTVINARDEGYKRAISGGLQVA